MALWHILGEVCPVPLYMVKDSLLSDACFSDQPCKLLLPTLFADYLRKPISTRAIDDFCQPVDRWSIEKYMQSPKSTLLNKHFEVTTADDYDFLISGTMPNMRY